MPKFIISPFTGKFDATASDSDITSVGDSRYLLLDQSTPQNITGGQPDFNAGLRAGSTDQLSIDTSGNILTTGTLGAGVSTLTSVKTATIFPPADGTTALQLNKADGTTNVLNVDTTNNKIEITGNLNIPNTTATTGIIYKGSSTFIHNFQHPTGNTKVPLGYNTFVGVNAGNLTIGSTATQTYHGSYNSGVGYNALNALTTGYGNTAFGYIAGELITSGAYNFAIGRSSLSKVTTASNNIGIGADSLRLTTGENNIGIGYAAIDVNTTGIDNVGIGSLVLRGKVTGSDNVAIGSSAGYKITGGSTNLTAATQSIFIGSDTKAYADSPTNEIVIGYDATGKGSNTVVLGNDSITATLLKGNVSTSGTLGAGAITGTSFIIGANTLNTSEWAFLDGQDQAVLTTSSPQFANLILTGGGNIYPSADSTTALGIASFAAPTVKLFSFDSTNKGFLMTDAVNLTAGQAGTTLSLARSVSGDYTAIAITNSNGLDAGISFNHTNGWGTITTAMSGIRSTRTNRVSSTDTDIGFMTNSGFVRAVRFKVRDDGMIYMIGGKGIYPSADSTTAWGVYKADATTNVMNIDTNNARVGIGTTAPVSLLTLLGGSNITPSADSTTALGIASFAAPTTKWVTFDTTNKRLGIGKTPLYQLEIGIGNDYATQAISCFSDTVAHNPYLTFIKSRNDTVGTLTETIDTDVIGSLLATGVNSSSTVATGAGIKFVQAGAAGATYVPIDISFQTGTNAAARTERMKIDNAGNITVGTASTNTMTMTARFIPRTTASDPQHVTAGSRPAGTVGEIAYYNGKWYGCTNAATPLWEKITSL
jgi:hypothetical protein